VWGVGREGRSSDGLSDRSKKAERSKLIVKRLLVRGLSARMPKLRARYFGVKFFFVGDCLSFFSSTASDFLLLHKVSIVNAREKNRKQIACTKTNRAE
jgi:hypothetical protein